MTSSFAHAFDPIIRIGDYVMTRPGQHMCVENERNDPLYTLKRSGVVPRSLFKAPQLRRGAGGSSSSQSTPSQQACSADVPRTIKFLQLVQRSANVLMTSSDDEQGPVLGIVKSVNARGNFIVDIWRRGDTIAAPGQQREALAFNPKQLLKLAPQEFYTACRRPFMVEVNKQLVRVSNGYDASAPVSLLAYNNRLIAGIMQRIDTTAHSHPDSTLWYRVMRNRKVAPGTLKRAPTPKVVPVIDPLAEVRQELRVLAGFSDKSTRASTTLEKAPVEGSPNRIKQATVVDEDQSSLGILFRRPNSEPSSGLLLPGSRISPDTASTVGTVSPPGSSDIKRRRGTPLTPSQSSSDARSVRWAGDTLVGTRVVSVTEELSTDVMRFAHRRITEALDAVTDRLDDAVMNRLPLQYYANYANSVGRGKLPPSSSPLSGTPVAGTTPQFPGQRLPPRRTTATVVPDEYPLRGSIERCLDGGIFMVRLKAPPILAGQSFAAVLDKADLFRATDRQRDEIRAYRAAQDTAAKGLGSTSLLFSSASASAFLADGGGYLEPPIDGIDALSRIGSQTLSIKPLYPNSDMVAVCSVRLTTGDLLAEELVSLGLARVIIDVFDNAAAVYGIEAALKLGSDTAVPSEVTKLWQAQAKASSAKLGMWCLRDVMAPESSLKRVDSTALHAIRHLPSSASLPITKNDQLENSSRSDDVGGTLTTLTEEPLDSRSIFDDFQASPSFTNRVLAAVNRSATNRSTS